MKNLTKSLLYWSVAFIIASLWWVKEFSDLEKLKLIDPARLRLQEATQFQYDDTGRRSTRFHSKIIERFNHGEIHYLSLQLWQKIPTGERIITAGEGHQKGDRLFLNQNVIAKQLEEQKPVITLKTEHITYDHEQNIIETDAQVSLVTPESQTVAHGIKWQMKEKLFILKKNIRSVYEFTPQ